MTVNELFEITDPYYIGHEESYNYGLNLEEGKALYFSTYDRYFIIKHLQIWEEETETGTVYTIRAFTDELGMHPITIYSDTGEIKERAYKDDEIDGLYVDNYVEPYYDVIGENLSKLSTSTYSEEVVKDQWYMVKSDNSLVKVGEGHTGYTTAPSTFFAQKTTDYNSEDCYNLTFIYNISENGEILPQVYDIATATPYAPYLRDSRGGWIEGESLEEWKTNLGTSIFTYMTTHHAEPEPEPTTEEEELITLKQLKKYDEIKGTSVVDSETVGSDSKVYRNKKTNPLETTVHVKDTEIATKAQLDNALEKEVATENNATDKILVKQGTTWKHTDIQSAVNATTTNVIEDSKKPLSSKGVYDKLAAENGIATLDQNGKLPRTQLPISATEVVGYFNATNTHTLPSEDDYINGDILVITGEGYIEQSTAWTLKAGQKLTEFEVGQANALVSLGYVFTLTSGGATLGTVKTFATDTITFTDDSTITLPYASDISATSTPSTVQAPVKIGDQVMLIDKHWSIMSTTQYVLSVNGKGGAVVLNGNDINATYNDETDTINNTLTKLGKVKSVNDTNPDDNGNVKVISLSNSNEANEQGYVGVITEDNAPYANIHTNGYYNNVYGTSGLSCHPLGINTYARNDNDTSLTKLDTNKHLITANVESQIETKSNNDVARTTQTPSKIFLNVANPNEGKNSHLHIDKGQVELAVNTEETSNNFTMDINETCIESETIDLIGTVKHNSKNALIDDWTLLDSYAWRGDEKTINMDFRKWKEIYIAKSDDTSDSPYCLCSKIFLSSVLSSMKNYGEDDYRGHFIFYLGFSLDTSSSPIKLKITSYWFELELDSNYSPTGKLILRTNATDNDCYYYIYGRK